MDLPRICHDAEREQRPTSRFRRSEAGFVWWAIMGFEPVARTDADLVELSQGGPPVHRFDCLPPPPG